METVNIHHAKTHLSKLVEKAANGESFIIAKAGKPMVKVIPIVEPEPKPLNRFGFLTGKIVVPDSFSREGDEEIERLFESCE